MGGHPGYRTPGRGSGRRNFRVRRGQASMREGLYGLRSGADADWCATWDRLSSGGKATRRIAMSGVIAVPEVMTSAAMDLATIGSNLSAAHAVAATPTLAVPPAAADEVSTGVAHLFAQHAQDY